MFSVAFVSQGSQAATWFDTAEDAMQAVNRLQALRLNGYVIRDEAGNVYSDRKLAMLVMELRLVAMRQLADAGKDAYR